MARIFAFNPILEVLHVCLKLIYNIESILKSHWFSGGAVNRVAFAPSGSSASWISSGKFSRKGSNSFSTFNDSFWPPSSLPVLGDPPLLLCSI